MRRLSFVLLGLLLLVLMSGVIAHSQAQSSMGSKYCGNVEKKYGLFRLYNGHVDITINKYYYIEIYGVIDSSTEDYVRYALRVAEDNNAGLVLLLNTPGGYLDAATNIVSLINRARVPVIAYVVDKWAESAGTLILVTSHVAAMQPGTIIGSMQPVYYNPQSGVYKPVNESKIINPIIKILCEHGATKGRNATALVGFVLKNYNFGAEEALRYHVIDAVADNMDELLANLSGSVVVLPSGPVVRLGEPVSVEYIPPPPRVVIVHALSDPILSGLLLSLGTLIIIFSIISGHLAYATLGALLLLLGLAGTGYSPNMVSLFLIIIGSLLLAIEIHTPGFGLFGGVGIVMLVLGIVLLPTGGGFAVNIKYANMILYILYSIGAFVGSITAFIVYKLIQVRRRKPIVWSIIGSEGRALDDIPPGGEGFIMVQGEYWKARSESDEPIKRGEKVVVVGKDGPILIVRKKASTGRVDTGRAS